MLRAAIVGLGWWGRSRLGAVQGKTDDIRFRVGHTRSPGKVAEFCRDHSIRFTVDYAAVLADPDVDAVVLATPPSEHAPQARLAAAAGKHVFVEKPFTLTVQSACDVLAAGEPGRAWWRGPGSTCASFVDYGVAQPHPGDGQLGIIEGCLFEHTAPGGANIRPDEWRANQQEDAGRRDDRHRHSYRRRLDRSVRPDPRGALHRDAPSGACWWTTPPLCWEARERDIRRVLLLVRQLGAELSSRGLRVEGCRRSSEAHAGRIPVCTVTRPQGRASGRVRRGSHRHAGLRHLAGGVEGIRGCGPREA